MNAPPDPSRRALDRVTVARRRAEQLAVFLSQAEQAVDAGDFETAVAACEQVLLLDPHNEVATRLVAEMREWHPATGGRAIPPIRLTEDGNPLPGDWPEESIELDMFPSEADLVMPRAPELAFRTELETADPAIAIAGDKDTAATAVPSALPSPAPDAHVQVEDAVTPTDVDDLVMRAPEPRAPAPSSPPGPSPVPPPAHREWAPVPRPAWTAAPSVASQSRLSRVIGSVGGAIPRPGWLSRPAVGTALLLVLALGLVALWSLLGPPPAEVTASVPIPPSVVAEPASARSTVGSRPDPASATEASGPATTADVSTTSVPSAPPRSFDAQRPDPSLGGGASGVDPRPFTASTAAPTTGTRETPPFTRPPAPTLSAEPSSAVVRDALTLPSATPSPVASSIAVSEAPTASRLTAGANPLPPPADPPAVAQPRPAPATPEAISPPPASTAVGLPSAEATNARDTAPPRFEAAPNAAAAEPDVTVTEVPSRPTAADDERAVRAAVQAYTSAYTGLDADAVKAVFPNVNDAALRRAFRSLRSQRVELRGASVAIAGNAASVSGTWVSSAVGQVGDSTPQRDERPVIFTLTKRNGNWLIVSRR